MELTQSMKNAASRSSRTCSQRPAGKPVKFNLEDSTYQVYDVDGKEMADDRRPKQAKSTIQSLQGVSCDGTAGAGHCEGHAMPLDGTGCEGVLGPWVNLSGTVVLAVDLFLPRKRVFFLVTSKGDPLRNTWHSVTRTDVLVYTRAHSGE